MTALERLLTIMQTLRDPQNGCPGSRANLRHDRPYTLEETYEVIDAIQREDYDDLRGELGDLLFQVVFYAQIAREEGRFTFDDICHGIADKRAPSSPYFRQCAGEG